MSENIDKFLEYNNKEVSDAFKEIEKLQNNSDNKLIFNQPWLDDNLPGGINNKIIFLGSRPSNGKTYHCSTTINTLLDKNINNTDVSILRYNLEMPTQTLILQQLSRSLNKSPKEILDKPFEEKEMSTVNEVRKSFEDERITNVSKVLKGQQFQDMVEKFCAKIDASDAEYNKKEVERVTKIFEETGDRDLAYKEYKPRKTKKICLLDHLMIYSSKTDIDDILLRCNEMKMADKNLSFIIYFQLKRTIEDMWRDAKEKKANPKNILPDSTFIYQTDVLQQIADIVVGMVIPQIYEMDEYVTVFKDRHLHLEEHFSEVDSDSNWVKLKGWNRIYYNFIKIRLRNSFEDPVLFCDLLSKSKESEISKFREKKEEPIQIPTLRPKQTEENDYVDLPTLTPEDAFGTPTDETQDPPF